MHESKLNGRLLQRLAVRFGRFESVEHEILRAAAYFARRLDASVVPVDGSALPAGLDAGSSVICWNLDRAGSVDDVVGLLEAQVDVLESAPLTLLHLDLDRLGRTTPGELGERLSAVGCRVVSSGFAPRWCEGPDRAVVLLGGQWYRPPSKAPEDFRVLAIITAYNEADVIRSTVAGLIEDGIDVHLIDNWSNDGTADQVEELLATGRLTVERFPDEPPTGFDLRGLLTRISTVAADSDAAWVVHHDSDDQRDSPWPGIGYRDALYTVDRSDFNAVDHTILEFRPTGSDAEPGTNPAESLLHFELMPGCRDGAQVQAWRNDWPVDLASSGGHDVTFTGRRVYPLAFTLRHYPVRSQAHGERKVFQDRKPRYAAEELSKGWHWHYQKLRSGHSFLRDPRKLEWFVPGSFHQDYLLTRMARAGFPDREPGPSAALREGARTALQRFGLDRRAYRLLARFRSR